MIKNEHELVHAADAGGGYHGRCKHCDVALVTDLGFCSWDGLKCVDREITIEWDIPEQLRSFALYTGMVFDNEAKKYIKPYGTEQDDCTIDELNERMNKVLKAA